MVECQPSKLFVVGPIPITRSNLLILKAINHAHTYSRLGEETHAQWMYEIARLYMPEVQHIPESGRYWDEVEATESMDEDNLQYACAIAAHAETMRLERITCIATDDAFGSANPLLQKYFKQILKDESFHAKAFARLAGEEAMERAKANHHRGMEALGLVI